MKNGFLYGLVLSVFLAGCAHQTKINAPVMPQDWAKHQTQVESFTGWQATGKLGVKVPKDGGSANLHWQQTADAYQIDIKGPFGQGAMTIQGSADKVSLSTASGETQSAKTAEELLHRAVGWTIPVTQLAYWVRGLPSPNTTASRLTPNPQGLISEMTQAGWTLTYGDYLPTNTANGALLMPSRIVAEYQDVRLTLVIREWILEP